MVPLNVQDERLERPAGARLLRECAGWLLGLAVLAACADEEGSSESPPEAELAGGDEPEAGPANGAPEEESDENADEDADEESGPEGAEAGRWRVVDPRGATLSEEQLAEIARLEAIGYLAGTTLSGDQIGVVRHDPERCMPGLNFYTSGHGPCALLMDAQGTVLHEWEFDYFEAWPDSTRRRNTDFWRRAVLLETGEVLAIYEGAGLIKIDKDSQLVWKNDLQAHHQLEVQEDGSIFVLSRAAQVLPRIDPEVPVLEDFVSILRPDGTLRRSVSLLKCLERSEFKKRWKPHLAGARDIFHTNSLKVLDGRHAAIDPAFQAGNVLLSMRALDALAIADLSERRLVWMHTGDFERQHDPSLLENGRMLVFDNRGRQNRSSVQEFDPLSGELHWILRGSAEFPFYSHSCGTAERLPNGNTLVTETDQGRAFEVDPDDEIVWEFHSPHRAGEQGELVASLFEVVRLPVDFDTRWAAGR